MFNVDVLKFIPIILFVALFVLQTLFPRRILKQSAFGRVGHNLLLFVANSVLTRFIVPLSLVAVSIWAKGHNIGAMSLLALPDFLKVVLCVIALDFAIYWQHVATHHWPVLWRMHKVHHADTEMDVTTAVRFHPLELLLSLVYKSLFVIVLGAPILAILIFELLLFMGPAFNHSNVKLPAKLDAFLRIFIATPDVHRAHHSTLIHEQNTNYGFFLIWWDKLFATYTHAPIGGHESMDIGLTDSKDQCGTLDKMLIAPFK
jgi:sterol desaturase/sphingolipid hydroxylase (fatty acid hydroxylase superfamily)